MSNILRLTVEISPKGRMTIPERARKELSIFNLKAYCQIEIYNENKALLTILNRWNPAAPDKNAKGSV